MTTEPHKSESLTPSPENPLNSPKGQTTFQETRRLKKVSFLLCDFFLL